MPNETITKNNFYFVSNPAFCGVYKNKEKFEK
jgi:hypothetical protein